MCRLPEAGKDSEAASQSATLLLFMLLASHLLLPSAGEGSEATSTFVLNFTALDRDYLKDFLWPGHPLGFGRRHCHSPGSEGCWVLIFVEERHHKNL